MTRIPSAVDRIVGLTPQQVAGILETDKENEYLLLDVRQPEEYAAGHIPGAKLVPLGELEARQGELDRRKKVIAYCHSGRRSMAAAIALTELGFKAVYNMTGGIASWPYETVAGMPSVGLPLIKDVACIRDVLLLAMRMEKSAHDLYREAGDRAKAAQVRNTFHMLARVEESHLERLYQRAASLPVASVLPPMEALRRELRPGHMEGGIEIHPAMAKVDEAITGEMDALELALEKEYMAWDFYKRAAVLIEDPDAGRLLEELASEERAHANALLLRLAEFVR
ncbi:MAG: hypothetical protein HY670_04100 [Chloroflexi bacterium]|nr:hypothetical protein [Chloroflexota bacterium]